MTMEMMKEQLMALCEDISFWENTDKNMLGVIVEDFEGFDEHWHEIMREYDNEEAVNALLDWLETNSTEHHEDFYTYYDFPDFQVIVGYSSFDI